MRRSKRRHPDDAKKEDVPVKSTTTSTTTLATTSVTTLATTLATTSVTTSVTTLVTTLATTLTTTSAKTSVKTLVKASTRAEDESVVRCLSCDQECNVHSQMCGACHRYLTFNHVFEKRNKLNTGEKKGC